MNLFQGQKFLFVLTHPDDDILSGSLMRTLVQNGCHVRAVVITAGENGRKHLPWNMLNIQGQELAKIRRREFQSSMEILGVQDFVIWNFPDSKVQGHLQQITEKLVAEFIQFQPDTVVTFACDGYTENVDHTETCRTVCLAAGKVSFPISIFGITLPSELSISVLEFLNPRRSYGIYKSAQRSNLSQVVVVEKDLGLLEHQVKIYHSQGLGTYLQMFRETGISEYYVSLAPLQE